MLTKYLLATRRFLTAIWGAARHVSASAATTAVVWVTVACCELDWTSSISSLISQLVVSTVGKLTVQCVDVILTKTLKVISAASYLDASRIIQSPAALIIRSLHFSPAEASGKHPQFVHTRVQSRRANPKIRKIKARRRVRNNDRKSARYTLVWRLDLVSWDAKRLELRIAPGSICTSPTRLFMAGCSCHIVRQA